MRSTQNAVSPSPGYFVSIVIILSAKRARAIAQRRCRRRRRWTGANVFTRERATSRRQRVRRVSKQKGSLAHENTGEGGASVFSDPVAYGLRYVHGGGMIGGAPSSADREVFQKSPCVSFTRRKIQSRNNKNPVTCTVCVPRRIHVCASGVSFDRRARSVCTHTVHTRTHTGAHNTYTRTGTTRAAERTPPTSIVSALCAGP